MCVRILLKIINLSLEILKKSQERIQKVTFMERKRIADIPLPDGLSEVQKAEFIAFQDAMTEIENEWEQLSNGTNPDQERCIQLVNEIKEKRYAQAKERLDIRLEVIENQVRKETEKIEADLEEYKEKLFERVMKAYQHSSLAISAQLKEQMGTKEFNQYMQTHSIDFPSFPSEGQMRTRTQQPDEAKPKLSTPDIEKDVRRIQQIVQSKSDV